jgi:hypothetical protein
MSEARSRAGRPTSTTVVTGHEPPCLGPLSKRKVQRVQRTESESGELAGAGLDVGVQRHIDPGTVDPEGRCEPAGLPGIRVVLDQMGGRADEGDLAGLRLSEQMSR